MLLFVWAEKLYVFVVEDTFFASASMRLTSIGISSSIFFNKILSRKRIVIFSHGKYKMLLFLKNIHSTDAIRVENSLQIIEAINFVTRTSYTEIFT